MSITRVVLRQTADTAEAEIREGILLTRSFEGWKQRSLGQQWTHTYITSFYINVGLDTLFSWFNESELDTKMECTEFWDLFIT